MDKSVLLVLLCLQAFLLITAFTSSDAVALVRDDQQLKSLDLDDGISVQYREKRGQRKRRAPGCGHRPGACSRQISSTTSPPPDFDIQLKNVNVLDILKKDVNIQ